MSRRASKADEGRERLLSLWERGEDAGEPIGCVATTFTFDAPFFEQHCLGRFVGMDTDPDEDGVAYIIEREERFSQVAAIVLVDAAHASATRSLRWHQLPATVAGGGLQHAKVSLLAWERRVRIIVASANLTEPGYRRNFESAASFDFTPEGGPPVALLRDVVAFLRDLAGLTSRQITVSGNGPRPALSGLLDRVESLAAGWPDQGWPRGGSRATFVSFLPRAGTATILDQVGAAWGQPGPWNASVLSPFFDSGDGARAVVDRLVGIMAIQGERQLTFQAPGRRLPDERVEIDLPVDYSRPWIARVSHAFEMVPELDVASGGDARPLHAKRLSFYRDAREAHLIGSSNFTHRGLGLAGERSNIEANVLYLVGQDDRALARACERSLPPSEDVDGDKATFVTEPRAATPEETAFNPLPRGLGEALFDPTPDRPRLLLEIDPAFELAFRIEHDDEDLLTRPRWIEMSRPQACVLQWAKKRPPSAVVVHWLDEDAMPCTALWVVNVTDTAGLPPPDELRHLPLDLLLEVLTSALPLHEVVRRAARLAEAKAASAGIKVDPHALVDTRGFLLRRMRALSEALEGLRERLERPVNHLDALRWRLGGPIGPLELARRLAEEEGEGAAFMVAEVALTIRRADWSRAEAVLGKDVVSGELRQCLEQLATLARGLQAPRNLRAHVDATLARIVE